MAVDMATRTQTSTTSQEEEQLSLAEERILPRGFELARSVH